MRSARNLMKLISLSANFNIEIKNKKIVEIFNVILVGRTVERVNLRTIKFLSLNLWSRDEKYFFLIFFSIFSLFECGRELTYILSKKNLFMHYREIEKISLLLHEERKKLWAKKMREIFPLSPVELVLSYAMA